MRATKAIIDLNNLKHNVRTEKALLKSGVRLCVSVKADAYGHGAVRCARAALEAGADVLSVATVDEGRELRGAGIKCPLLLFGVCAKEEVCDAVRLSLTPFVFDAEYIELLDAECRLQGLKVFPVHLAIDSGMGRIGCKAEDAGDIARLIARSSSLTLGGCVTHFAWADGISGEAVNYTARQKEEFLRAIENIKKAGINPGLCHAANSAAILNNPDLHFDMVRAGIITYGYYPDEITKEYLLKKGIKTDLRPVMTLESEITSVRTFRRGECVGYGCTWCATEDTDIAVVPIGYADGWLRRFSDCGVTVAAGGRERPIRGRICMDQCMIDLGRAKDAGRWSRVVLFGDPARGALQDAGDIARLSGTISYEITCGISKRVPRVYVE